jgi:hypothetical protein
MISAILLSIPKRIKKSFVKRIFKKAIICINTTALKALDGVEFCSFKNIRYAISNQLNKKKELQQIKVVVSDYQ